MQSGGVEQVVLELGKAFSSQGIHNIVVSSGGRLVEQLERDGSRHIAMPIGKKSLMTLFQTGRLARLLAKERPDILHLHSRVPAWIGLFACRRLPAPFRPAVVTTVHGMYSVNPYSAVMTKGDRVIAVSRCIRDYILTNYPQTPSEIIRVIPNSIDPSTYNPAYKPSPEWLAKWTSQYPELQGKYNLCLPGRLTRIKGHLDLIPILSELNKQGIPAHVVIVGEAGKSKIAYKQELIDAYRQAGLDSQITWVGHRNDLIDILSFCSATLALATAPEAFGKTTLESLSLGKPVAGYAHGGIEEQLRDFFPDGLIPVGNTAAAASKLAEWYHTPPSVPHNIPREYTIDGMIQSHLDLYRELRPDSVEP